MGGIESKNAKQDEKLLIVKISDALCVFTDGADKDTFVDVIYEALRQATLIKHRGGQILIRFTSVEQKGALETSTSSSHLYDKTEDQDEELKSIMIGEAFRILSKNGKDVDQDAIDFARNTLRDHNIADSCPRIVIPLLSLVMLSEVPASKTFKEEQYQIQIHDGARPLYRAGRPPTEAESKTLQQQAPGDGQWHKSEAKAPFPPGNRLGQYFTFEPPADLTHVRRTCAVKDDWDAEGLTVHELLAPLITAVYRLEAARDSVLYVGKAAPLGEVLPNLDGLAAKVLCGGGEQVMLVRPWGLGALAWPWACCRLPPGPPWQLLGYEVSGLSRDAFAAPPPEAPLAPGAVAQACRADRAGPLRFSPLHHAVMRPRGEAEDAAKWMEALLAAGAAPLLCATPDPQARPTL